MSVHFYVVYLIVTHLVPRSRLPLTPSFARKEKSFNNLTNSFDRSTSPIKAQIRGHSKAQGENSLENREESSIFSQVPGPDRAREKGKAKAANPWQDDADHTSSPISRLKFEEPEYWRPPPVPATQEPFAPEPELDVFGANALPKTPMKARDEVIPSVEMMEPVDLAEEVSSNVAA